MRSERTGFEAERLRCKKKGAREGPPTSSETERSASETSSPCERGSERAHTPAPGLGVGGSRQRGRGVYAQARDSTFLPAPVPQEPRAFLRRLRKRSSRAVFSPAPPQATVEWSGAAALPRGVLPPSGVAQVGPGGSAQLTPQYMARLPLRGCHGGGRESPVLGPERPCSATASKKRWRPTVVPLQNLFSCVGLHTWGLGQGQYVGSAQRGVQNGPASVYGMALPIHEPRECGGGLG